MRESAERLRCPLTGQSVADSWQLERPHLAPLPQTLPTPFDTQVQRPVGRDGLVRFDGREYGVPIACVGGAVQRIVLPKSWDWQAPTRPLDGYAALVERAGRRS